MFVIIITIAQLSNMVYISKRSSSLKLGTATSNPQQSIVNMPEQINFNDLKEQWFAEMMQITDEKIKAMLAPFMTSGVTDTTSNIITVSSGQNHNVDEMVRIYDTITTLNLENQALKDENRATSSRLEALESELRQEIAELQLQAQNVSVVTPVVLEQNTLELSNVVAQPNGAMIDELTNGLEEMQARLAEIESALPKRAQRRGSKKEITI
jgi:hypothetical protein